MAALSLRQYPFNPRNGGILVRVKMFRCVSEGCCGQQRQATHEQDGGDHARVGGSGAKEAGEADKCHRHEPGCDQGNGRAFEGYRHIGSLEAFA